MKNKPEMEMVIADGEVTFRNDNMHAMDLVCRYDKFDVDGQASVDFRRMHFILDQLGCTCDSGDVATIYTIMKVLKRGDEAAKERLRKYLFAEMLMTDKLY